MDDLPDFHEWDLNFPLNHLDLLSSFKLALVQFHDTATLFEKERAAILFKQRRLEWLEEERDKMRGSEERNVELKPLVKEEAQHEPPPEEAEVDEVESPIEEIEKKVESKVELEEVPVRIEEIIIDDDTEEDEAEALPITSTPKAKRKRKAPGKGKGKEKEKEFLPKKKKRKTNVSNSDRIAQPTKQIPPIVTEKSSKATTSPKKKQVNLFINRVKLPSFKRIPSNSASTTSFPASPVLPPPSSSDSLPDPSQPSAPTLPIFVPNPTASLARNHPDSQEESPRRVGRPSVPGPFFTPLPSTADEDPFGSAPYELVKQLVTIRFAVLDVRISPHLLLLFLSRNQTKLQPRPVAFRKVILDSPTARDIFVAFKSEEDAKKTVEMQSDKQLPFFDNQDSRTLYPRTYDEGFALQLKGQETIEAEKKLAFESGKNWLPIDWKWGELSDEVRREWRISSSLPRARYIPRMTLDDEVFISEEYEEEVWIHLDPFSFVDGEEGNDMSISEIREKRRKLNRIKRALYEEECEAWITENLGKEETSDLVYPKIPADGACLERYAEMERRELEKVKIEAEKKREIALAGGTIPSELPVGPTLAHPTCKKFKEAHEVAQTLRGKESEGDGWKSAFLANYKMTTEDFIRKERGLLELGLNLSVPAAPKTKRVVDFSKRLDKAPFKRKTRVSTDSIADQSEQSTPSPPPLALSLFARFKAAFLAFTASKEEVLRNL